MDARSPEQSQEETLVLLKFLPPGAARYAQYNEWAALFARVTGAAATPMGLPQFIEHAVQQFGATREGAAAGFGQVDIDKSGSVNLHGACERGPAPPCRARRAPVLRMRIATQACRSICAPGRVCRSICRTSSCHIHEVLHAAIFMIAPPPDPLIPTPCLKSTS
jgi:hypothetical protein